ncbi:MAG: hypothetical protein ACTSQP_22040 [Promethearchaeota archaeon]
MPINILRAIKDNEIYYYAKEIEINGRRFKTPLSLKPPTISEFHLPRIQHNEFYEIWRTFKINDIENAPFDDKVSSKFISKINSLNSQNLRNASKIFFLSFKFDNFEKNPFNRFNDRLIEFILDSIRLHTDIFTFPLIRDIHKIINNQTILNKLLDFLKKTYQIYDTLNNKPIMGIIPPIPQGYIPQIVNLYNKLEIKMFCFDFCGSGLSRYYPHYFQLLRSLYRIERELLNESIKYTLNLRLPVNRNWYKPFPAEDMILPALATDFLGLLHIGGGNKPPKFKRERKLGQKKKRSPKNINLLNINDYAYYRIAKIEQFNEVFKDPIIHPDFLDFNAVNRDIRNEFRKKFNYSNMNIEMNHIHNSIVNNEPIMDILNQKINISEEIPRKIKNLDNFIKNTSITDFL